MRCLMVLGMLATSMCIIKSAVAAVPTPRVKLQIKNSYTDPSEVVRYYLARDAAGFVWTGLLTEEVAAFTLWDVAPQHDSFYLANNYKIVSSKITKTGEAQVSVRYELDAVSDAHGTRVPTQAKYHDVVFKLRLNRRSWKIYYPRPTDLPPVVVESQFSGALSRK